MAEETLISANENYDIVLLFVSRTTKFTKNNIYCLIDQVAIDIRVHVLQLSRLFIYLL